MEGLNAIARSLADDLAERHVDAAPDRPGPPATGEESSRLGMALLRWVETRGMDGELLLAGWELGSGGYRRGEGLGALTDRVGLVEHELIEAAVRKIRGPGSSLEVADVLELARWLRGGVTMLTRTALKGFIVGRESGHRRWLRDLRHDLRNPIGAIKNAISLLEETSEPASGTVQRLCSIAARNVGTLESLVRHRAAEEADLDAVHWGGRARPTEIVERVLGSLREAGDDVARRLPPQRSLPAAAVDALGLEIALHAIIRHTLGAPAGGVALSAPSCDDRRRLDDVLELRIALAHPAGADAVVVEPGPNDATDGRLLTLTRAVVEGCGGRMGGDPWEEDGLVLTFPLLAGRDEGYDLGGAGKRDHWQPRTL